MSIGSGVRGSRERVKRGRGAGGSSSGGGLPDNQDTLGRARYTLAAGGIPGDARSAAVSNPRPCAANAPPGRIGGARL